jgi:hypothetical protein
MFCHAHEDAVAAARCTSCGVLVCTVCRERRDGRALCHACAHPLAAVEIPHFMRIVAVPVRPRPKPVPAIVPVVVPAPVKETPAAPEPPRPAARRPSPALAGILGVAPGLGQLYAGSILRGLGFMLLGAGCAVATIAGGLPIPAYAFLHGLVAFDGYRLARKRRGEWSSEDAREARGVFLATAGVLTLLFLAHSAGAALTVWLVGPALLVPLGVGLALGERSNRIDARAAALAKAEPTEPAPGKNVDRRADRAALAEQLV